MMTVAFFKTCPLNHYVAVIESMSLGTNFHTKLVIFWCSILLLMFKTMERYFIGGEKKRLTLA